MVELGIFRSYRSVDSDGMCYVRGINRIKEYNISLYEVFFKIYISEGIIYVDKYININRESTVTVTGIVQKRTDDMINPNMKTGEIEVNITSLEVLGECQNVLPFEISRSKESTEDTRLNDSE